MTKRIAGFWVCLAIIIVFLFLYGWSQGDAEKIREFKQYSIEIIEDVPYVDEKESIEKLLNEKGWLGWQLVSFTKERKWRGDTNYCLIFERTITLIKIENKKREALNGQQ
ncbi:hypothetical protein ES702_06844 [subsurface metagenome]